MTGTYAVTLVPTAATTQSAFKLSLLQGGAIQIDGAPADVAIANPGEAARLTFAGVAGENLGLGVSGVVAQSSAIGEHERRGVQAGWLVARIDGLRRRRYACAANLENLPVTGTYTVIVQPANGATGTQRVWLSRDAGGVLASGTPASVALSRPGQNARLTFAGTAGSLLSLQVRGVATNPSGQGLPVVVNQPSKQLVAYTHLTGAGQTLVTPPLPVTGTYTVFIEPEPAAQAAATATMEVLLDPGRALDVDGATQATAIGVAGGSARFVFPAMAGQNLGLGIGNLDLNPRTDATASVYKPDGTQFTAYTCTASAGSCSANLLGLPATGSYGIVVRPTTAATGSLSATLSSEVVGALSVGGSAARHQPRPSGAERAPLVRRFRGAGAARLLGRRGRRDRQYDRDRHLACRFDDGRNDRLERGNRHLRHSGAPGDGQLRAVRRSPGRRDASTRRCALLLVDRSSQCSAREMS